MRPTAAASSSRPVEMMTGFAPAARASAAIASQAVSPVTRSVVWISSSGQVRDLRRGSSR